MYLLIVRIISKYAALPYALLLALKNIAYDRKLVSRNDDSFKSETSLFFPFKYTAAQVVSQTNQEQESKLAAS